MKILMCGDIHGEIESALHALEYAKQNNCEIIVILGDFGYYHNIRRFRIFLTDISEASIRFNIPVHFIKGNHENHDELRKLTNDNRDVVETEPNVFYHPNANVWRWDGVTFLAMGGANSIDKGDCTEGVDWFRNELITNEDISKAHAVGPVDVVLSHDSPISSNITDIFDFTMDPKTRHNRYQLQQVIEACRPKINLHGHYHVGFYGYGSYYAENRVCEVVVIGLSLRGMAQFYIFDTEEFKKEN